jgi:hypothetical protein
MGLHSAESVDQRTLDGLVVADLDRGTLQLGKDDGLMRRCLNHPYMQRLERRVRCDCCLSCTDTCRPGFPNPQSVWCMHLQTAI